MLKLKGIRKVYDAGDTRVEALKGVDLNFRRSEFVAVLGPSGCGKTTLLNLIGGLDGYTEGDLVIRGRSTKDYKDRDWDSYRNHSVGFVFQSYNLIPHQTVLRNVELALTLSGVGKRERRRRAEEALKNVGLGDQLHKKPAQMSGGQMQRVAIARALVNDPEILLADEPTGALDSATSVQVMDLLNEIAKNRLVIMVTHNPELADRYANRIIRLLDGKVVGDTAPYDGSEEETEKTGREKKPSMSFMTALGLSLNNLMTKKARTFLTAFAGSIGIIGIALILALSNGVNNYIDRVQEDTLSSYPLKIEGSTVDMTGMMEAMMGEVSESRAEHENDRVYANSILTQMFSSMLSNVTENNLAAFKVYLDNTDTKDLVSDIKYGYSTPLTLYYDSPDYGMVQVNPSAVFSNMGMLSGAGVGAMNSFSSSNLFSSGMEQMDVWEELMDNEALLNVQFDVVAGRMPKKYDEAVVIVNSRNEVSDYAMYALGLRDPDEPARIMQELAMGREIQADTSLSYSFDEILGLSFTYIPRALMYEQQGNRWVDRSSDPEYLRSMTEQGLKVRVVGIIRPSDQAVATSTSSRGGIGYLSSLTEKALEMTAQAPAVKAQMEQPDRDIFTGLPFAGSEPVMDMSTFDLSTLPVSQQAMLQGMSPEQIQALVEKYMKSSVSENTYKDNMTLLGMTTKDAPSSISIYPRSFEAKDTIINMIDRYNEQVEEKDRIRYTDYVGLLMSSVTTIINAISYILVAFVAISLVVSSIMIGIITYISVLERTKEIGILRAIGASKRDISRVFNAETLIEGFAAGVIGIGVTLLLVILVNVILLDLTSIANLAGLPVEAAIILVVISMVLTFIAGLIPSRIASRKDPVIALRSE